jgi:hypothetical protein
MVDFKRGLRNPAGLSALVTGDVENFLVAARPGGIEAQEARGQADLTRKFTQLPKDGLDRYRKNLEHLGFKIGEDDGDIFVSVAAPAGWTLRPSDHSVWSYIHDDQGRRRGGVFYKAAFYDRSAHFSLQTRYQWGGDYRGQERYSAAKDTATGAILFELGPQDRKNFKQSEIDDGATLKYLNDHYPDWANVEAYW